MRTLALIPCLLLACDAPDAQECPASAQLQIAAPLDEESSDLSFREQPFASYISSWNGKIPITSTMFAEAILICSKVQDPEWLLTLSAYSPQVTNDRRVVGLGGSAYANSPWLDCMKGVWQKNGGIQF